MAFLMSYMVVCPYYDMILYWRTVFTQNNEKMHVRKPSDCCFTPNQQFLCYGAVIIVVIVWLDKNDIMDLFEVLNHYLISLRFSTEFVFFRAYLTIIS